MPRLSHVLAVILFMTSAAVHAATSITGHWDGMLQVPDGKIAFRFDIGGTPDRVEITYFDGDTPVRASTGGHFQNGALDVDFASYATKLAATLDKDGTLRGTIGALPFEAHPAAARKAAAPKAPDIAGVWEIPLDSAKGEKAWRLVVDQKPTGTYAAILRIDGDTGTINGVFDGTAFNLSRFAAERPVSLKITPQADGSLALVQIDQFGKRELKALRPTAARTAGLAAPADPARHTGVKDPSERMRFSGADLDGRQITQDDPRFKGKVVVLNITGSWCPNCHDEAPFLAELDAKYRAKGLEVVGLDFENPEDMKELKRLRAFIQRYGLKYTVLVAGVRQDVNTLLPQAVNLNAWPTTFFIGRDGKVRTVHVGFPSRGSKEFDRQARAEITQTVEQLLSEGS